MEAISGTHGIDDDVGEGTGIEAFDLDMLAEGSEVAVDAAQLGGGAVGVLRRRNGGDFGFGMFAVLRLLHASLLLLLLRCCESLLVSLNSLSLAVCRFTTTLRSDRALFCGSL